MLSKFREISGELDDVLRFSCDPMFSKLPSISFSQLDASLGALVDDISRVNRAAVSVMKRKLASDDCSSDSVLRVPADWTRGSPVEHVEDGVTYRFIPPSGCAPGDMVQLYGDLRIARLIKN